MGGEPKASLLIVDDDGPLLRALCRLMRRHFEVVSAPGAQDAQEVARRRTFDLVLSDYTMPGLNGVQLLRWLKQEARCAAAALLTAVPEMEDVQEALKSGLVDAVFEKPWAEEELVCGALALVERYRSA